MNHTQLAEALFDALEKGDADAVRAVCAADLAASQNGGAAMDLDGLVRFARAVKGIVPDFRYADARRVATASGFVEEHRVCGTLPDGSSLDVAVCVVADVRGGKVVALREYLDTAAATTLLRALSRR